MSIRNSGELGVNLMKMATKLLENQRLCKLLKYTDDNPLSETHSDVPQKDILHKNLKVVPLVNEEENNTESTIVLIFTDGEVQNNTEFKSVSFDAIIYTPFSEWLINDVSLRPFLIMSEIEKTLKNKRIESLGTITYRGFNLHMVTDIMGCYKMSFSIDVFD